MASYTPPAQHSLHAWGISVQSESATNHTRIRSRFHAILPRCRPSVFHPGVTRCDVSVLCYREIGMKQSDTLDLPKTDGKEGWACHSCHAEKQIGSSRLSAPGGVPWVNRVPGPALWCRGSHFLPCLDSPGRINKLECEFDKTYSSRNRKKANKQKILVNSEKTEVLTQCLSKAICSTNSCVVGGRWWTTRTTTKWWRRSFSNTPTTTRRSTSRPPNSWR